MKTKGIAIAQSFCALLLIPFLFSSLLAVLYHYRLISNNTLGILNDICGILAYGIAGMILGHGIQKKALLHALGCMIIYIMIGLFLMNVSSFWGYLALFLKVSAYLLGSVLATNLHQSS